MWRKGLTLLVVLLWLAACGDDADPENNDTANNATNNATNNANNPTMPTDEFTAVATIIARDCGTCHGMGGRAEFKFEGGVDATPAQIQAGLEGVNAANGTPLITASDTANSRVYQRLEAGEMPLTGGPLDAADLTTIETWIAGGAAYTQ